MLYAIYPFFLKTALVRNHSLRKGPSHVHSPGPDWPSRAPAVTVTVAMLECVVVTTLVAVAVMYTVEAVGTGDPVAATSLGFTAAAPEDEDEAEDAKFGSASLGAGTGRTMDLDSVAAGDGGVGVDSKSEPEPKSVPATSLGSEAVPVPVEATTVVTAAIFVGWGEADIDALGVTLPGPPPACPRIFSMAASAAIMTIAWVFPVGRSGWILASTMYCPRISGYQYTRAQEETYQILSTINLGIRINH